MYQIKTPWQRIKAYFEFWIIDHEFVRAIYRNFHKIDDNAYRSAHPSPNFIKKLRDKYGVKTIINLRGANETGQYMLELEACENLGVKLISTPLSSRDAPTKERLINLMKAFDEAEYPVLLHCKSGADRAGLGSAMYQFYKNNIPLDESRQLRASYGHFKSSETGMLDHFIDTWSEFHNTHPEISFQDWVNEHYDSEAVQKSFHTSRLGNILVNKILRRE